MKKKGDENGGNNVKSKGMRGGGDERVKRMWERKGEEREGMKGEGDGERGDERGDGEGGGVYIYKLLKNENCHR